ncbi:Small auxin-up RNA protein [Dioscorea alata]|uniref:Small auxin-up RNA protein n=1 Tax=Dioscorea alata TaxID=55571 RepID=A0ACB7WVX6_DIOAL|nr:Small auxin-up RNA protein [Dioscorea alata]
MGGGIGKCSKIRHIVRLRQMLRRWRRRAAGEYWPSDVPAGHVVVCVGSSRRRFVVRAAHLNHPVFRRLLAQAEEEYGFAHAGPLTIPCDESLFEEILRHIASPSSRFACLEDLQKCGCCHAGLRPAWHAESLPLLGAFAEKPVW